MTTQYAVFDPHGLLFGLFDTKEQANDFIQGDDVLLVKEIHTLPTTLIHCSDYGWDLFEVCLDTESLWVMAESPYHALVEVCTACQTTLWQPHSYIKSYPVELLEQLICVEEKSHPISPLTQELLTLLTPENKDLLAHLLYGAEDFSTMDDMVRDGLKDATMYGLLPADVRANYPPPYTASEIFEHLDYMWISPRNWMFFEETGASLSVMRLMADKLRTANPKAALFWTFVFCAWGQSFAVESYVLYLCLVGHEFDEFWESLSQVRSLLAGE